MLGTYHLTSLFDILNKLHFIYEPPALWNFVLESLCKTLQSEAATYFELTEDEQSLQVKATFGMEVSKLHPLPFKVGVGISGWVAQFHQPALVNDVRQDNRFNRQIDLTTGFVTRSILCVPVFSQKRTYGVIEVLNKKAGVQYSPQDQEFMTLLGRQTAIAYQNLILLEDSTKTKVLLESLLENLSGGLVAMDQNRKITLMNPAAGKLLQLNPATAIGKPATLVFMDLPWFTEIMEKTLTSQATVSRQEVSLTLGAETARLGYTTILIASRDKQVLGSGVIFQKLG